MTPKEKAEELYYRFLQYTPVEFEHEYAKQCALIAVDEIINHLIQTIRQEYGHEQVDIGQDYWQQVKNEIELL